MSSRFFVPPEQIQNSRFTVLGSEARHAALVLRKKQGDVIDLFDGKELSFRGRIESVSPERVEGIILEETSKPSSPCAVTLYQALIKGPRWDWLVEKACEVGASRLVPLMTARTIVKPSRSAGLERWRRIALAASKQSGRAQVMNVSEPVEFSAAIQQISADELAFIPWEKEPHVTIRQNFKKTSGVSLFVGPEGGWEESEVDFARRRGIIPVTIGPTLLRSETAGLVSLAQVLSETGD